MVALEASIKDHFESYLRDMGMRLTQDRLNVLQASFQSEEHFDAEQLQQRMRDLGLNASRATIYRTLDLLLQAKLIGKVMVPDSGQAFYEPIFGRDHHDHMYCLGCGSFIEFVSEEIEEAQDRICREYGFTPTAHLHRIQGYCKDCKVPQS